MSTLYLGNLRSCLGNLNQMTCVYSMCTLNKLHYLNKSEKNQLHPITILFTRLDDSYKPSSSPSLEEDEGFSDWTQKRERQRQLRQQELTHNHHHQKNGAEEEEEEEECDPNTGQRGGHGGNHPSLTTSRLQKQEQERQEMERRKKRQEEEVRAERVRREREREELGRREREEQGRREKEERGKREEQGRREREEQGRREREEQGRREREEQAERVRREKEEERRKREELTKRKEESHRPNIEEIERRRMEAAERMKSLSTSSDAEEAFSPFSPKTPTHKKTPPLVPTSKIDDKLEQYTHAIEVSNDTEGLKVGVANLITQWVKGPNDSSRQGPGKPTVNFTTFSLGFSCSF
uniref:Caldesmon 1b n=1 Tax=Periophthalmus magnuspinnatus TaxID=409849 RepID=A0A3B3ZRU3_9GOBI